MDAWEYHKTQYELAVNTYQHAITSGAQLATLVLLADVTAVGFTVASRVAGLLLATSVFPIVAAYVFRRTATVTSPILYAALIAEDRLSPGLGDGVVASFVGAHGRGTLQEARLIAKTSGGDARMLALASFTVQGKLRLYTPQVVLCVVAFLQALASLVLPLAHPWKFM